MIPIKEAIDTGAWLLGEYKQPEWGREFEEGEPISFQIKLLEFTKVNLESIDNPEQIDPIIGLGANIWLLRLDIVNLCKKPYGVFWIKGQLLIEDDEGFQFAFLNENHLTLNSDFAKSSGLRNFYSQELPPKTKRSGSLIFELPEFFDQLNITVKNGSIKES